jgi:hypothetical protein
LAPPPHSTNHDSRGTYHQSLNTNHASLIASRPLLEIDLTHSQQTRKLFLIASFSAISAVAPQLNDGRREFLTATDQTEKIANHKKLNAKRFSNCHKFAPSRHSQFFPVTAIKNLPHFQRAQECGLLGCAGGANLPGGVGPNWLAGAK